MPTQNIHETQHTQIYSWDGITPDASDATRNKGALHRGMRVSLEPEQRKSEHLMATGGNDESRALRSNANHEHDLREMQPRIIDMERNIAGNTSDDTSTPEMEAKLLARGVDRLVKYYAKEKVDFAALPLDEQNIAVQHYAPTPSVAVRDVPAPAVVVDDTSAPDFAAAIPAISVAPKKIDTSDDELPIKSDLSDAQWDSIIESLTEKTLQVAEIDREAYNNMPVELQDEIYALGFQLFLKDAGLNMVGLSSLTDGEYLALVEKYTAPVEQDTAGFSDAAVETVEDAVSSESASETAPVVEEVAMKPKRRKAKRSRQQRSVETLPAIFVSGSSRQIELDPLLHRQLIQGYGDNSLQADLAMTFIPQTDR
jgi:hypothetical protein